MRKMLSSSKQPTAGTCPAWEDGNDLVLLCAISSLVTVVGKPWRLSRSVVWPCPESIWRGRIPEPEPLLCGIRKGSPCCLPELLLSRLIVSPQGTQRWPTALSISGQTQGRRLSASLCVSLRPPWFLRLLWLPAWLVHPDAISQGIFLKTPTLHRILQLNNFNQVFHFIIFQNLQTADVGVVPKRSALQSASLKPGSLFDEQLLR